jgi:hypothetical protein
MKFSRTSPQKRRKGTTNEMLHTNKTVTTQAKSESTHAGVPLYPPRCPMSMVPVLARNREHDL